MIVLADGSTHGTVGGGLVEARVIEEARRAMDVNRPVMLEYNLDGGQGLASLDMDCGGSLSVFVEVFGARPRLVIAGGGHVGLAVATLAAGLGFRTAIIDDRPDFVTHKRFPMATELYVDPDMDTALESAPVGRDDFVLIATHSADERSLRALAARDCAYLGFLGSRRKVRMLLDKLAAEGVPETVLGRVRAPVGLNLGAETPEEIALSVMAEIMTVRSGRDGLPLAGRDGELVVVRGGGDLATGCALRLRAAGFRVVVLEVPEPMAIRRAVALSEAVYDGTATVEGVRARRAESLDQVRAILNDDHIPVLVDPDLAYLKALSPLAIVDATLAKKNLGLRRGLAPIVIGVGPGFEAGADVDAAVETQRGHDLGTVILSGRTAPDSGVPGEVAGKSSARVLRAPVAGTVEAVAAIGDAVAEGDVVLRIKGDAGLADVRAPFSGVVRGLIRPGYQAGANMKIADVDPRGKREYCFTVSDKARAVGGGVLEAVMLLKRRIKR